MAKRGSVTNSDLYKEFVAVYKEAKSSQAKQLRLQNAQTEWNTLKNDKEALLKRQGELQHQIFLRKNRNDALFLRCTAQKATGKYVCMLTENKYKSLIRNWTSKCSAAVQYKVSDCHNL